MLKQTTSTGLTGWSRSHQLGLHGWRPLARKIMDYRVVRDTTEFSRLTEVMSLLNTRLNLGTSIQAAICPLGFCNQTLFISTSKSEVKCE